MELVSKTRLEHLADSDKEKAKSPKTPLQSFLGITETEYRQPSLDKESVCNFFSKVFLFSLLYHTKT